MISKPKVYVKRTKSNVFMVFTNSENKLIKIISGGMIKIKGLSVRRKKVFFGTINYMAHQIGNFILSFGLKEIEVFFGNGCKRYLTIILQKFLSLGLIVLNLG